MPDLDITPLIVAGVFAIVLAIFAVLAVGVSWLGYPTAALWIVGVGAALGWIAARLTRKACG
ncbi:hypothetical protein [Bradyrhizobium sp. WSM4349]|uniref:hypothetical protein n=1 Tax=Bradyrhizobium sp. WSM4349 TaxID=1040988 RepID=UPI000369A1C2|nr:hypothetical protein [Bradyrhizobium sp. WSM4349]